MKISLAITTYNRPDETVKAFEKVYNDPRIDEIIIIDDCSLLCNSFKLIDLLTLFSKVRSEYNEYNIGMSLNKRKAIGLAKNEWVIILDSDNEIDSSYLNALYRVGGEDLNSLNENAIYCPSGALPKYDYSVYNDCFFHSTNAKYYVDFKLFQCLLNTCNYVVNREKYLNNFKYNEEIGAADTIWHNYNHMKNGGHLYVVPGMTYKHAIHDGSGWRIDRQNNIKKFNEVIELIKQL